MNIVTDTQEAVSGRIAGVDSIVDIVLGVLDQIRAFVVVVCWLLVLASSKHEGASLTIRIQVEVGDMVAKVSHIFFAA